MTTDEGEEVFLEVRAGATMFGALEVDAFVFRLPLRSSEEVRDDGSLEVLDSAWD